MVALLFARELRDSSVNDSVIDIVNRGVGYGTPPSDTDQPSRATPDAPICECDRKAGFRNHTGDTTRALPRQLGRISYFHHDSPLPYIGNIWNRILQGVNVGIWSRDMPRRVRDSPVSKLQQKKN
uniref:Uncharacterized protein n=1 Tax=Cacopsylla melanoneura TaxID=428564 RepID=A0A8D8YPH5_9HEMI